MSTGIWSVGCGEDDGIGYNHKFQCAEGYGFIEPETGGEDVFVHRNDLNDHRGLARSGTRLEFNILRSGSGLKAADVTVLRPATKPVAAIAPAVLTTADDPPVDVLSRSDYAQEVTDVLIAALPSITATEIVEVRQRLCDTADRRRWLDG